MWKWVRVVRRKARRKKKQPSRHYLEHKESTRAFVHERLHVMNAQYGFVYKKVAIRDQRRRWGSCSKSGNLNFNYRIKFLPAHLADYIIVHELCHLKEFNHGRKFWALVGRAVPAYETHKQELHKTVVKRGVVIQLP